MNRATAAIYLCRLTHTRISCMLISPVQQRASMRDAVFSMSHAWRLLSQIRSWGGDLSRVSRWILCVRSEHRESQRQSCGSSTAALVNTATLWKPLVCISARACVALVCVRLCVCACLHARVRACVWLGRDVLTLFPPKLMCIKV